MTNFWRAIFLNILGIFAVTALIAFSAGREAFLFAPVVISTLECLVALILLVPVSTRRAAQIMLAASGIVFLIGCGICSVYTGLH